mmetsp:Transcript_62938/g.169181  ORF Transcript_62938/g.169181 Transcript_62938/m.169181 type:complete len:223 (+) Transcript_62938:1539-2207(+)
MSEHSSCLDADIHIPKPSLEALLPRIAKSARGSGTTSHTSRGPSKCSRHNLRLGQWSAFCRTRSHMILFQISCKSWFARGLSELLGLQQRRVFDARRFDSVRRCKSLGRLKRNSGIVGDSGLVGALSETSAAAHIDHTVFFKGHLPGGPRICPLRPACAGAAPAGAAWSSLVALEACSWVLIHRAAMVDLRRILLRATTGDDTTHRASAPPGRGGRLHIVTT